MTERIYDNTHKNHFAVPKMPWHTEDHKFGESSDEEKVEKYHYLTANEDLVETNWKPPVKFDRDRLHTIFLVDEGKCYYCKAPAVYACQGYLYCSTCWLANGDEDSSG